MQRVAADRRQGTVTIMASKKALLQCDRCGEQVLGVVIGGGWRNPYSATFCVVCGALLSSESPQVLPGTQEHAERRLAMLEQIALYETEPRKAGEP